MIIALIGAKGGSSRTTTSYLIALALAHAGKSVEVEDLDPQQSLTVWVKHERDGIDLEGRDFTIVDTPPNLASPDVHRAIAKADVIIVPTSPSPSDLGTVKSSLEAVEYHRKASSKVMVLLTQAKPGTILTENAGVVLEKLGASVASTIIPQRQNIQKALVMGWKALSPAEKGIFLSLALEIIS